MKENEFWFDLEYRICDELASSEEKRLRRYWCDGIFPYSFHFDVFEPYIDGAWFPNAGTGGTFRLFIGQDVKSREEIDWDYLLPEQTLHGWLSIEGEVHLVMKPLLINSPAAVEDAIAIARKAGLDISFPILLDFSVVVPDPESGQMVSETASAVGYNTRVCKVEEYSVWICHVERSIILNLPNLNQAINELNDLSKFYGGYVHSWFVSETLPGGKQ